MLFCFGREKTKKEEDEATSELDQQRHTVIVYILMKVSSSTFYSFPSHGNTAGMMPQYSKWSQPQYCTMRQAFCTDHTSDVQHCWVNWHDGEPLIWENKEWCAQKQISRVETASTASWKVSNCREFYKAALSRRWKSANLITCQANWQIKTYDLLKLSL